jgi:hypothetical protein
MDSQEILKIPGNPWTETSANDPKLRRAQERTLGVLLKFVETNYASSLTTVEERLCNAAEFEDTLSELFLLFALSQTNSWPSVSVPRYFARYSSGEAGPDITIAYDDRTSIGIEVTRPKAGNGVNNMIDLKNPDFRSDDEKVAPYMKKLFSELEAKTGQLAKSTVKMIALDVSEYVSRVFFPLETHAIDYHMESYLYGQWKVAFNRETVRDARLVADPHELPSHKGPCVCSFFKLRGQIAAVIYFWRGFYPEEGCPDKGRVCRVWSRLALNPFSSAEQALPGLVAFTLANVLNQNKPFWVAVAGFN